MKKTLIFSDNGRYTYKGDLVVDGDLVIDKQLSIEGNLIVRGNLTCYDLNVTGSLVAQNVEAENLVAHEIKVGGLIQAENIQAELIKSASIIAGKIRCKHIAVRDIHCVSISCQSIVLTEPGVIDVIGWFDVRPVR